MGIASLQPAQPRRTAAAAIVTVFFLTAYLPVAMPATAGSIVTATAEPPFGTYVDLGVRLAPALDPGAFRVYDDNTSAAVRETYKQMRVHQTHAFAEEALRRYCNFDSTRTATFWELFDMLMGFIDLSDPDISLSNHQHLFQTAEGLRRDGMPEWMQFVGLAHDLGKIVAFKDGADEMGTSLSTQWAIVGDTYITGCALPDSLVFPEFNALNADMHDLRYNSTQGVYAAGSGLSNALFSFGHDEYIYRMFKHNGVRIPEAGYYMLRFHSLYPWHDASEYGWIEDAQDKAMKPWVNKFNQHDLYTKENVKLDEALMRARYAPIVEKFAPGLLEW